MARFYPIYVRRSDGKLEIVGRGKVRETNQPTASQLNQKPDKDGVSDFYREVTPDEMKHLDWRRKLGGMLARELQLKDKVTGDTGCILVDFPENYRLYEHVKKTERDGKTEVKTKTHAGGGNDRQDAYLYGHPAGRRKRFRSPADFFPHLLWLCTDETGDPDNCSCKICSPEDLDIPTAAKAAKTEKAPVKQEALSKPVINQGSSTMSRQSSGQGSSMPTAQRPTSAGSARPISPTPLQPPKSVDQQEDRRYGTFIYRPGEIVWFRRLQAWGLGVVLRRWKSSGQNSYTVQPLSHPGGHSSAVTKSPDSEMRPWLAWSVPQFTHPGLNDMAEPPRFETADWEGMKQKRYGTGGDLVVDGSILAAKSIDNSYTPVGPTRTTEVEPGLSETCYDGMFLGAEKIWTGEPVRLSTGTGTDIMVVHQIAERKSTAANGQVLQHSAYFVGDIYSLVTVSHSNPNVPTPAAPNNNPQLPQRLTEDLAYRNARSIHVKRTASYWKLQSAQSRISIDDVKGRWYESSLLLPILQGDGPFQAMAAKGEILEASLWMNSRADCQNANRAPHLPKIPKQNIRKSDRRAALGQAIPSNERIKHEGMEPPGPENIDPSLGGGQSGDPIDIDPMFDTAQEDAGERIDGDAGIDQYMNLELPDEFSQNFGNQGQGFY